MSVCTSASAKRKRKSIPEVCFKVWWSSLHRVYVANLVRISFYTHVHTRYTFYLTLRKTANSNWLYWLQKFFFLDIINIILGLLAEALSTLRHIISNWNKANCIIFFALPLVGLLFRWRSRWHYTCVCVPANKATLERSPHFPLGSESIFRMDYTARPLEILVCWRSICAVRFFSVVIVIFIFRKKRNVVLYLVEGKKKRWQRPKRALKKNSRREIPSAWTHVELQVFGGKKYLQFFQFWSYILSYCRATKNSLTRHIRR